jgi:hypothetical protein
VRVRKREWFWNFSGFYSFIYFCWKIFNNMLHAQFPRYNFSILIFQHSFHGNWKIYEPIEKLTNPVYVNTINEIRTCRSRDRSWENENESPRIKESLTSLLETESKDLVVLGNPMGIDFRLILTFDRSRKTLFPAREFILFLLILDSAREFFVTSLNIFIPFSQYSVIFNINDSYYIFK